MKEEKASLNTEEFQNLPESYKLVFDITDSNRK